MGDYLICSLKTSEMFQLYEVYTGTLIQTGIYYLDLSLNIFFSHSFISLAFYIFQLVLQGRASVYEYIEITIILLLAGFIIDIVLYFLGKYLGKYLKFKYESKKLFYIFLRFVPIIGIFGAFIGSLLSKEFDYKTDFLKIFIGNLLFVVFNIVFWVTFAYFCGNFTE
ncbi:hypothetical protein D8B46_06395 [Candidatus Gracilibacteria bacterium]|nr:MAG: hypothetical protein D8B46_06395 [Candidatus Gracilibacteria bacterium]